MTWDFDAEQGRSAAFRSLLREVEASLNERVNVIWEWLPEPKVKHAEAIAKHCGFTSSGKGVLRDLLYLMINEHATYRQQIIAQHGDICEAISNEMFIDQQEQIAEHLASTRASARLRLESLPNDWRGYKEPWMTID